MRSTFQKPECGVATQNTFFMILHHMSAPHNCRPRNCPNKKILFLKYTKDEGRIICIPNKCIPNNEDISDKYKWTYL